MTKTLLRCAVSASLLSLILAVPASPVLAVVVDHVVGSGTTPVSTAPVNTDVPTDAKGDPGWYRVPANRSAVYLGNQWMLSARHASMGTVELDAGGDLPAGTYEMVPGSAIVLSNPSTFGSDSLTAQADLRLWRIKPESTSGLKPEDASPGIASDPYGAGTVTIASSPASLYTPVRMIGNGRARRINADHPQGHTTITNSNGTFHGIEINTNADSNTKTWGDNRIDNASLLVGGSSSAVNFSQRISNGNRDIIGQLTQFDSTLYDYPDSSSPSSDAAELYEAQAAADDSGGPVFHQNGSGDWVLSGVMHAIAGFTSGPGRLTEFGDLTIFTDLSQDHYRDQINALLSDDFETFNFLVQDRNGDGLITSGEASQTAALTKSLTGYSINGDLNLDGVVSGDGTGDPTVDDVAAFLAGWGSSQEHYDIYSWRQGDLDLDGDTDRADFMLMRQALEGVVPTVETANPLSLSLTPEPSSLALLAGSLLGLGLRRSR